ncbi:type IV secretory system conjugative DNA transfer family protein [Agromyces sp. Marseille-Q5079]|uniref:type IV secretory system conjugative DNA transfer family protein n=1 Tax=Agromyces sp. Marseille-Q5079 TaxID=3439059 RepID=UPI003D9CA02E
MASSSSSTGLGDEATNLGLATLMGAAGLALVLRGAGSAAAWVTGLPQPSGDAASGLAVLLDPSDPGAPLGVPDLNPVVFWVIAGFLLACLLALAIAIWRMTHTQGQALPADVFHLPGIASKHEVAHHASRRRLLRRARHLRPSLAKPEPSDVGYRLGSAHGVEIWASVEDSFLILGPPRSGKGANFVINAILDAPGAVVTTSTRADNLTATMRARQDRGPVAVFDPQHLVPGIPSGLRWSPIRGCEDPLVAIIRARGLAAGTGLGAGGVEGGGFWEAKTRVALQALLHAAALDRRSPSELFRWTLDPASAADAAAILASNPNTAIGWADSLQAMLDADPRTRDSIWQGVSLSLAALADPRVLDAVSPGPDEQFHPEEFLRNRGTLYLLATGAGANSSAALVSAFIEDLVETARHLAAGSPGVRLDPPLLLALDEIGNLAPLPSLPSLVSEGGGTGITTMPVLQSLGQARDKWSAAAADTIWEASIVKIMLGGSSNAKDLHDVSTIIGNRDEVTDSTTIGDRGSRSAQRSIRRVQTMPEETIRTLPDGAALFLLSKAPPIIAHLRAWTDRPESKRLVADRTAIETLLVAQNAHARPSRSLDDEPATEPNEPDSQQEDASSGSARAPEQ